MPDAYNLGEGRFLQHRNNTSGVNSHLVTIGPVPAGKIWTVLSAVGAPSVDESQEVWFVIYIAGMALYGITAPVTHTFDVSEANWIPCLREGMEIKLFPGESLGFCRAGHTVGSTISLNARLIETDLPLYTYEEPQVIKRQAQALSTLRQVVGGGTGITPGARVDRDRTPGERTKA